MSSYFPSSLFPLDELLAASTHTPRTSDAPAYPEDPTEQLFAAAQGEFGVGGLGDFEFITGGRGGSGDFLPSVVGDDGLDGGFDALIDFSFNNGEELSLSSASGGIGDLAPDESGNATSFVPGVDWDQSQGLGLQEGYLFDQDDQFESLGVSDDGFDQIEWNEVSGISDGYVLGLDGDGCSDQETQSSRHTNSNSGNASDDVAEAPPSSPAPAPVSNTGTLTEHSYRPVTQEGIVPPKPNAPVPLYPAYSHNFTSGEAARQFRKRRRVPPKSQATDIQRVKRYGRPYWVRRIYNSMIDISCITDGISSIHRARFESEAAFDALDLEAAAHHVFDAALAVHERGWTKPLIYHKKVVRGKLIDVSEKSLELRLARICMVLQQKKAAVDDALRGGVTLALLCDNPEARGFTKFSNNAGNEKRGRKLKAAKDIAV